MILFFTLKLLVVRQIETRNGEVAVTFENGQRGHLVADLKDPAYALELAHRSLDRKLPVGVSISDSGAISEVVRAENDVPTELFAKDKERMGVWFQGHNGVFCLQLNHPRFQHIRDIIDQARRSKSRVWFVARKPGLMIEDVLPDQGSPSSPH